MSRLLARHFPISSLTKTAITRPFTAATRNEMSLAVAGTGKPRVILGTMTFGPDESTGARVLDLDTYKACLDAFQVR